MEYPISRLYQIQKRIQEAISDLLPEYNKTLQRRVTNLLGTPEERQTLTEGFQKSDAALERYQKLNELLGNLRAQVAVEAVEATQLQAVLEATNREVRVLTTILSDVDSPTPLDSVPALIKSRMELGGRSFGSSEVILQDRIAAINLKKVDLVLDEEERDLLEEFVGM